MSSISGRAVSLQVTYASLYSPRSSCCRHRLFVKTARVHECVNIETLPCRSVHRAVEGWRQGGLGKTEDQMHLCCSHEPRGRYEMDKPGGEEHLGKEVNSGFVSTHTSWGVHGVTHIAAHCLAEPYKEAVILLGLTAAGSEMFCCSPRFWGRPLGTQAALSVVDLGWQKSSVCSLLPFLLAPCPSEEKPGLYPHHTPHLASSFVCAVREYRQTGLSFHGGNLYDGWFPCPRSSYL